MSDYETILAQFRSAQRNHLEGNLAAALALYDAIIRAKPDLEEVYSNRGVVLRDLRRFEAALESFNRAIEINPALAEAYNNKGFVLIELGRLAEALASLDHSIRLRSDFPDAHNNRGVALRRMNQLTEALKSYDRAIALCATYGEAWSNRGEVLTVIAQLDHAIASFERALALMPHHADTLLNCALAFQKKGRFREARSSWTRSPASNQLTNACCSAWPTALCNIANGLAGCVTLTNVNGMPYRQVNRAAIGLAWLSRRPRGAAPFLGALSARFVGT